MRTTRAVSWGASSVIRLDAGDWGAEAPNALKTTSDPHIHVLTDTITRKRAGAHMMAANGLKYRLP